MPTHSHPILASISVVTAAMAIPAAAQAQCGKSSPDCYTPHGSPGCADVACCAAVCEPDPFCCDAAWDSNCVARANSTCRSGASCGDATWLDERFPASYGFDTATGSTGTPSSCGTDDARATWRRWVADCTATVKLRTCAPSPEGQIVLAVYEACGGEELECRSHPVFPECGPYNGDLSFSAVEGQEYLIRISTNGAANDSTGTLTLACGGCGNSQASCYESHNSPGCAILSCCSQTCIADPHCCDAHWDMACVLRAESTCRSGRACWDAVLLSDGFPESYEFYTGIASFSGPSSCGVDDTRAAWKRVVPACNGRVTVSVCTADTDGQVVLAVFDACDGNELACDANAAAADCGAGPAGTVSTGFVAWAGRSYLVRIAAEGKASACAGTLAVAHGPCVALGDIDADGLVNALDLSNLLGHWGAGGTTDLGGDGATDAANLALMLGNWG